MPKTPFTINPPLLNSSSPWATTVEQVKALYESPFTGAVTTRTSLLEGFTHDPKVHQHVFFAINNNNNNHDNGENSNSNTESKSTSAPQTAPKSSINQDHPSISVHNNTDNTTSSTSTTTQPTTELTKPNAKKSTTSSLNTYGYSPLTLSEYLGQINEIVGQRHLLTSLPPGQAKKPFILSVTGTPDELAMAYALIANAAEMDEDLRLAMEVNLSCPNIDGKPPPAYSREMLGEFVGAVGDSKATYRGRMDEECVPRVGVKLPPYTWMGQFEMVAEVLAETKSSEPGEGSVVDFVTCVNTLGSSLVLGEDLEPVLNSEAGTGVGGLAGAALHPLALGNVATLRRLLDARPETKDILIIGVGGVEDKAGFDRMRKVGAGAVGLATALGREGIQVFETITNGEQKTQDK